MARKIPFADYTEQVAIKHRRLSFNDVAKIWSSSDRKIQIRPGDVYHILQPYITPRFLEQFKAVVPLALYLVLFQLLFLRQGIEGSWTVTGGLLAVIVGLMLFMEGLKLGLMPLGGSLGESLPTHSPLAIVLGVVFLLGIGVTFAEPAIGALKTAGAIVSPERTPLLFDLLNRHSQTLVLIVGMGVGLAAVLGTLRFVYNWSLKPLIYASVLPCLVLTGYAHFDEQRADIIGLAWDSGAVTTGPVTVPLVLALGIGVARAVGRGSSSLSGFGIVTLASLFPISGVLLLGLFVEPVSTPLGHAAEARWFELSPVNELLAALRAIVPLVLFLLLVMKFIVKKQIRHRGLIAYGVLLCVLGLGVFNLGLSYGLAELGNQSGGVLPAAFAQVRAVPTSPIYHYSLGILIVVFFAWFLGFGATLAEPALNALGLTVETLTNGAFPKRLLMWAVAFGVACGIALGVVKLIYALPLSYFLLPGYLILVLLTVFSTEEFVNVAWDSAGVTTGPITVPLVLAMGLGLGETVLAREGFGVLALASLFPIGSVLTCGLYIQWRTAQSQEVFVHG